MLSYITQTFNYIAKAISYPDDSKDPFEAGDLVEISEVVEYVETNAPMFKLPPELIAWYKEGRRRLYSDRDDIMEWLRLKRINKLDGFIRYLNLDRLDDYIRIHKC
ncbi:6439_t:CDS:2 [Entrophospora sp. SA101]|nr:6439_t:CDS:2 [Entrophospora sp. SA101]